MSGKSPRPPRPAALERQLRREAGYGCCRCGRPVYQYHHIVPYKEEDPYPAGEMMILCPWCHDAATKGAIPEEDQWRMKQGPHNIRRGLAGGDLIINQSYCAVQIGECVMVGDHPLVTVDGHELLGLKADADTGQLLITANVYDDDGTPLALIEDNELMAGNPFPWDIESDFQYLRLRERLRHITLEVDARAEPVRLRADLRLAGQRIHVSPRGIVLGDNAVTIAALGLVGSGLEIDSATNRTKIVSMLPKGATLVSEPDSIQRLVKSVEAWNRLKGASIYR
jgi:hypothetical protein